MPHYDIVAEVATPDSFRVAHVAGLFDVPLAAKCRREWHIDLPLDDDDWQIGVIVGPSGSGKSSIARAVWPDEYTRGYEWNADSVLDNFDADLETKTIISALTSVGFSSPPDWIKPYSALSTGQQMRCDLARALVAQRTVVFDEFTSVVDRTVAQIGSAAIAKAIRAQPARRFVAVTCHEDVIDWLAPDWIYTPLTDSFCRRSLRRPDIELQIARCHHSAWRYFKHAHYLSADLNPSAQCYIATWRDMPVGFVAALPMIGFKGAYRLSRTVVLPDFQGVGIGSKLSEAVADILRAAGKRVRATTSHPGMIAHRQASPLWQLCGISRTGFAKQGGKKVSHSPSRGRGVATFEYIGESPC